MTFLARFVLAGFLLSLGVAAASPVVQPRPLELVCSNGVYKLVAPDGTGVGLTTSALHCPQCLPASLPPDLAQGVAHAGWGQAIAPALLSVRILAVQADLPPPARAPPAASA